MLCGGEGGCARVLMRAVLLSVRGDDVGSGDGRQAQVSTCELMDCLMRLGFVNRLLFTCSVQRSLDLARCTFWESWFLCLLSCIGIMISFLSFEDLSDVTTYAIHARTQLELQSAHIPRERLSQP